MTLAFRIKQEKNAEFGRGAEKGVESGSCLAKYCGLKGHIYSGLDCVKTLTKQRKQLTILFRNITILNQNGKGATSRLSLRNK